VRSQLIEEVGVQYNLPSYEQLPKNYANERPIILYSGQQKRRDTISLPPVSFEHKVPVVMNSKERKKVKKEAEIDR
jgi:hypothetical protein